jgi:imidazolonepropionase-like amidohydrolase
MTLQHFFARTASLSLLLTSCGAPRESSAPLPPSPTPPASTPDRAESKPLPQPRVARRSVVILSRKSGTSVTTFAPDGSIEFSYEHLENGRGPKFAGKGRLSADRRFTSFEAKGKRMMGNPIDERFAVEGGIARWNSPDEKGETALGASAFYFPNVLAPEFVGILREALERAGGRLPLLPAGEATLERTGTATVRASGREKKLIAWAITGLEFTPTRIWTEEDGSFFGSVDNWYSCIAEGWEDAIETLVAIQNQFDAVRDRDLAKRLSRRPPAQGLAVTHARVLDVEKKRWLADHTVVVVGDRITEVGPSKTAVVPKDSVVIDAKGSALVPGLWDMHAHLGSADGLLNIASGVTTVRDLGNDPDRLDDFKKRFDEGSAIGPHVLRSGFIEGRGEKAAGAKVTAETEDEAKAAVEFFAKRGYEGIKIYNSMKPELVPVLARLAHERKMRVSGHVPMHMLAADAVRAGYDEIQHVNMLFLNFFADKNTDTRTPLRFSLVADNAANFDLGSKAVKDFFKLLIEKKTVVDPTVGVFESLFVARPGKVPQSFAVLVERLPVQVQRWFTSGGLVVPEGKDQDYVRAFEKALMMVKALYDAKIPIVAGTDSVAGLFLHHELQAYARAGLPNGDVLQIATLGAARVMKRDKTEGSIARGKVADFFLVDGDPLADLSQLRKITVVVRGGTLHDSSELYRAVGVRP